VNAPRIRIGVSSCLLGERVRFDGQHKRDPFVSEILAEYFELVPVCPEVAIGLGVPRPPIRLVGDPAQPRAVGVRDPGLDVTPALAAYGRQMAAELAGISGYVLKAKSPSCGMERVKVYPIAGGAGRPGRGIYADALIRACPLLPVEEEGRLHDAALRENFIGRVHALHRWQQLLAQGVSAQRLVEFHTRHKLILMAHSKERLRELGRLIAAAGTVPAEQLAERYGAAFMQALRYRATRRRHTDVLFHVLGYLKRSLDAADKAELVASIESFRLGEVPLIVPVTLLRHHFRRHPHPYIDTQLYLSLPPRALAEQGVG
jgi:uncharacterized protein YbgA (DUF1722 family)/uncharacterized protein YbbK (DUF523 family)